MKVGWLLELLAFIGYFSFEAWSHFFFIEVESIPAFKDCCDLDQYIFIARVLAEKFPGEGQQKKDRKITLLLSLLRGGGEQRKKDQKLACFPCLFPVFPASSLPSLPVRVQPRPCDYDHTVTIKTAL